MSCRSGSRRPPVVASARLSTSVPRSRRLERLMPSTGDSPPMSIDIPQVAAIGRQPSEPLAGLVRIHATVTGRDVEQRRMYIGRHEPGIAADIERCATGQPGVEL